MREENRNIKMEKVSNIYGFEWKVSAEHIPNGITLSAAENDRIIFFSGDNITYALSMNARNNWIGLQELIEGGINIFFPNATEVLRTDIFELDDITVAEILWRYKDDRRYYRYTI